jgi:5-methyltetrahydrofolate--homocysteine methyltransferase
MSDTGFDETPEITGALVEEFAKAGFLNIAGGCCGTTPDHIREIAQRTGRYQPRCLHGSGTGALSGLLETEAA